MKGEFQQERLIRNAYPVDIVWGIPKIRKDDIANLENLEFMSYSNAKKNDFQRVNKAIHFFQYDLKFESVYNNYESSMEKLAQYKVLLTPDFSLYPSMPFPIQLFNTFKSRWCGAYWQHLNLPVIPTVNWSDSRSYDFCFKGIEKGSTVAVSTLGVKKGENRKLFLAGYQEMIKEILPQKVICYEEPLKEMHDFGVGIICFRYRDTLQRGEK